MDKLWEFVRKTLVENGGEQDPRAPFRSRFEHTKRVYNWMEKLSIGYDIDEKSLRIATIFHDIGRNALGKEDHARTGGRIFREYATENQLEVNIDFIVYLIENHSSKELLKEPIPTELVILLEADLLDEEGATGIAFDLIKSGYNNVSSYEEALQKVLEDEKRILSYNPFVTKLGRQIWVEKQELVSLFVKQMKRDLNLE